MIENQSPAEEYREIAGRFTELVEAVPDERTWARPPPVAGWTARDVVRHLVEWFPGFLADGAGVVLSDGVQSLLDDPTSRTIGEVPLHEGPRVEVPDDADVQTKLIAFIGRDPR